MVNGYFVRALLALGLAAFLWLQARGLRERPQRRRAFELAALALLALAALNGNLAAGYELGALQYLIAAISIALFIGAAVSLLLSLRSGEAGDQREQISAAAREYRQRREAQEHKRD